MITHNTVANDVGRVYVNRSVLLEDNLTITIDTIGGNFESTYLTKDQAITLANILLTYAKELP